MAENTTKMSYDVGKVTGDSAYEIAVKHGYTGTEEEWIKSQESGGVSESAVTEIINRTVDTSTLVRLGKEESAVEDVVTVDADMLGGKTASDYALKSEVMNETDVLSLISEDENIKKTNQTINDAFTLNENLWISGNITKTYTQGQTWAYTVQTQEVDVSGLTRLSIKFDVDGLIDDFVSSVYMWLLDSNGNTISSNEVINSMTNHVPCATDNEIVFDTTIGSPAQIKIQMQVSSSIATPSNGVMTIKNIVASDYLAEGNIVLNNSVKVGIDNLPSTLKNGIKYAESLKIVDSLPKYERAEKQSLSDGEKIELSENHIKKNKHLLFCANIGTFQSVIIGHGDTANGSARIKIDDTNIYVLDTSGNATKTIAHGLTIVNNIMVDIVNSISQYGFHAIVKIYTNGTTYASSGFDIVWLGSNGIPYVESVGSTLNNSKLFWSCDDFSKNIYAFGDSYFDFWTPKLAFLGHTDNILLDAFGGRGSISALISFNFCMEHGNPKYLLWCLGMNDLDTESTYNTNWYNTIQTVISYCNENGITPILATIPNTPTHDNNFKNTWIKESGYRYIDVAKYVNSYNNEAWDDGLLSSDNVHPTTLGSQIIAENICIDLADILIN